MRKGPGARRLTSLNAKKAVNTGFRSSEGFKKLLIHTAGQEGMGISEWLMMLAKQAMLDRGVSVPTDLPEYDGQAAPEGSLNHRIDELLIAALPRAKDRSAKWASNQALERVRLFLKELEWRDDPELWNEFYETVGWPGRTAREKLHTLKFRMQKYLAAPSALREESAPR